MTKTNIFTWAGLMMITTVSFLLSDHVAGISLLFVLILFTGIKVFLVSYQYMGLKKAHPAWIIMIAMVLVIYADSVIGLLN